PWPITFSSTSIHAHFFRLSILCCPPLLTLFPYTTLFRSPALASHRACRGRAPESRPPLEALLPARAGRQGRPPAREARHSDPHDDPRALAEPPAAVPPSAPYRYEGQAWRAGVVRVAGLDEAGRGPLA